MELQGKIIAALDKRSGTSARGEWQSQEFVLETHDTYPKKMVFSVFGADRLARFNIQVGQEVMVSFDIDAREYQGRWFNSIRAFDVRLVDPASIGVMGQPAAPMAATVSPEMSTPTPAPFPPAQPEAENKSEDDLPF